MGLFSILLAIGAIVAVGALLQRYCARDAIVKRRLRRGRLHSIRLFPQGARARIVGRLEHVEEPLVAPLSGRRCAHYHVVVEVSKGESGWQRFVEDEEGRDFLLSDGTGRALVRMSGAEVAVTKDVHFRSGTFNAATPSLELFLAKHGRGIKDWFGFNRPLRYKEGVLEDGEEVTVCGVGRWEDGQGAGNRERRLVLEGTVAHPLLVSDDTDVVRGTFTLRRRFREHRGQCVNCGYDLRGQTAPGCPECGWRR